MRLRNNPKADEILSQYPTLVLQREHLQKNKVNALFKDKPLEIEIGMGKGDFILEMAQRHPDIFFIGVEKYKSVLVVACKKIAVHTLDNLFLLQEDAAQLLDVFEAHSIHKIYLNFSDPWPKKKHEKRRLTYTRFLDVYRQLLKEDGCLEFKTDNRSLFEYSLKSMNQYGMIFEEISLDLHHSEYAKENIMSEYEKKFCHQGPIYRLKARFK